MPTLYSSQVKCPTCSEWQNEIWIDEETNVKMTRKKLGLDIEPEDDPEVTIRKLTELDYSKKIDNKI
jgi:hypothetical protein